MRTVARILTVVATVLAVVLLFAYSVMWLLVNGPSPSAKRLFVLSVKETSAAGFLADLFLSENEISEILSSAAVDAEDEELDYSLVKLPSTELADENADVRDESTEVTQAPAPETETVSAPSAPAEIAPTTETEDFTAGIEVVDVAGQTFNGKMMIIADPKRVFVGVPDSYGENSSGLSVAAMIEKYDCIAGTNAGGFYDPDGQGSGGIPEGIVIYEGELLWGDRKASYSIAGLDRDGRLHVGKIRADEALEKGIVYAASYGPALVVNGKSAGGTSAIGGGLNPRTAIGQRADGAILLLVVNGRSVDSLGATFDDLAAVMLEFGAVNATNLDGGSSSLMIMNGEHLTSSSYIFGERVVATAILVKKQ